MKIKKVFGLYGWSGSGKTDLICRVISYLTKKGLIISTIKHTHHNFKIDHEGKDSYQHRISGAREVLLGGKNNWALIHNGSKDSNYKLNYLLKKVSNETDLILVEGFKNEKIPKIEVYNSQLNKNIIGLKNLEMKAVVYDKIDANIKKILLPKFDFRNTKDISNFIVDYFKKNEKN